MKIKKQTNNINKIFFGVSWDVQGRGTQSNNKSKPICVEVWMIPQMVSTALQIQSVEEIKTQIFVWF